MAGRVRVDHNEWTPADEHLLAQHWLSGMRTAEIAEAMGRTQSGIQTRASNLGLPHKTSGAAADGSIRDMGSI